MKSLIITYDLRAPNRNYDKLYEKIKSYRCAKINESCWLIKTHQTHTYVRNYLKTALDSNDSLFVAQITGLPAWSGEMCEKVRFENLISTS